MPPELTPPDLPLARWAGDRLAELARITQSPAIARLSGAALLGERAMLGSFAVPGLRSAGGGCRLLPARDGWIALNLAREDDRGGALRLEVGAGAVLVLPRSIDVPWLAALLRELAC